jgi:hypothetical protein
MAISPELLYGHWLHAHEEDSDDEMVFRPDAADLPPSRGRQRLELNADGSYAETRPGADDRPEPGSGRWSVESGDRLVVDPGDDGGPARTMRIVAADGNSIIIRKPGGPD